MAAKKSCGGRDHALMVVGMVTTRLRGRVKCNRGPVEDLLEMEVLVIESESARNVE